MFAATDNTRRESRRRRGFALPLAILALALVTAAVAASSAATRAEVVANQAVRAQDHAYQLAQAGLQQFMASRCTGASTNHCVVSDPSTQQYNADSTEAARFLLTGGYADVVSVRVRPKVLGDSVAIFFIRSRGVDTTIKMSGTGPPVYAERTVGEYATFATSRITPRAALVSIAGLRKAGFGSAITGSDACAVSGACTCPGFEPSIAGLMVPKQDTGSPPKTVYEYRRGGLTPDPSGLIGVDSTKSIAAVASLLGIDWNAIVNNKAIPADYTNSWVGNTWAVTRYDGDLIIDNSKSDGKGILIVTGNLRMQNNRDFDGIILVGGRIVAIGGQESAGLAYSGLNYLLPGAGSPSVGVANDDSVANNKSFRYNSCNVSQAMALLTSYYAWSNTWLDNVAAW